MGGSIFVLLAPSQTALREGYQEAKRLLAVHGFEAYDPWAENEKSSFGHVRTSFEFLGCQISLGIVIPDSKSRKKLRKRISSIINEWKFDFDKNASDPGSATLALGTVLTKICNTVLGWANSHRFCNFQSAITQLDHDISGSVCGMLRHFAKTTSTLDPTALRRLSGIPLLTEVELRTLTWHSSRAERMKRKGHQAKIDQSAMGSRKD